MGKTETDEKMNPEEIKKQIRIANNILLQYNELEKSEKEIIEANELYDLVEHQKEKNKSFYKNIEKKKKELHDLFDEIGICPLCEREI
jgi:HD-like signal output (HDOD) protein